MTCAQILSFIWWHQPRKNNIKIICPMATFKPPGPRLCLSWNEKPQNISNVDSSKVIWRIGLLNWQVSTNYQPDLTYQTVASNQTVSGDIMTIRFWNVLWIIKNVSRIVFSTIDYVYISSILHQLFGLWISVCSDTWLPHCLHVLL